MHNCDLDNNFYPCVNSTFIASLFISTGDREEEVVPLAGYERIKRNGTNGGGRTNFPPSTLNRKGEERDSGRGTNGIGNVPFQR